MTPEEIRQNVQELWPKFWNEVVGFKRIPEFNYSADNAVTPMQALDFAAFVAESLLSGGADSALSFDERLERTMVGQWMESIDYAQANLHSGNVDNIRLSLRKLYEEIDSWAKKRADSGTPAEAAPELHGVWTFEHFDSPIADTGDHSHCDRVKRDGKQVFDIWDGDDDSCETAQMIVRLCNAGATPPAASPQPAEYFWEDGSLKWGHPLDVGHLIMQLQTLDPHMKVSSVTFIETKEGTKARAYGLSMSRERWDESGWLNFSLPGPECLAIWAKERQQISGLSEERAASGGQPAREHTEHTKGLADAAISALIQYGLMAAIDRAAAMSLVGDALEMVAKHDQELGYPPNEGEF